MSSKPIRPQNDRLLVEILPRESESVIIRPTLDDHDQEPQRVERARVLDTGPGRFTDKGAFIETQVRRGQVVLYQACMGDAIVGLEPGMHRVARECEPGDKVLVEEKWVLAVEDGEEAA